MNGSSAPQASQIDPRHARGLAGEQNVAFTAYKFQDGWAAIRGPSGTAGHRVTASGEDGLFYNVRTRELHIVDNKSLKRAAKVYSATAIDPSKNLLNNLNEMIKFVQSKSIAELPYRQRVLSLLRKTKSSIIEGRDLPTRVKLIVANAGGRAKNASPRLKRLGIEFLDVYEPVVRRPGTKTPVIPSSQGTTNTQRAIPNTSVSTSSQGAHARGTPRAGAPTPATITPSVGGPSTLKLSPPKPTLIQTRGAWIKNLVKGGSLFAIRFAGGLILSSVVMAAIQEIFGGRNRAEKEKIKRSKELSVILRDTQKLGIDKRLGPLIKKHLELSKSKKKIAAEENGLVKWHVEVKLTAAMYYVQPKDSQGRPSRGGGSKLAAFFENNAWSCFKLESLPENATIDYTPILAPPKKYYIGGRKHYRKQVTGNVREVFFKIPVTVFYIGQFLLNLERSIWENTTTNSLGQKNIRVTRIAKDTYDIDGYDPTQTISNKNATWNSTKELLTFPVKLGNNLNQIYYFYPISNREMKGYYTVQSTFMKNTTWLRAQEDNGIWKINIKKTRKAKIF
ncbi:MAG: hypothetical protein OER82_01405 [Nitrosopumilus sp.]|nr:hypothetical protein [Nitrosopumilus sp.]